MMLIIRISYRMFAGENDQSRIIDQETQSNMSFLGALHFSAFGPSTARLNDDILLFDNPITIHSSIINCPAAIYIDHQKGKVRIEPNSPSKQERGKEGDDLVLEVFPHFVDSVCKRFSVVRNREYSSMSEKEIQRSTFVVVGSNFAEGNALRLKDRDVIKLGRERFVVRIGLQEKVRWYDRVYHQEDCASQACRICLSEQPSHQFDFIISPCKCSGSQASVHIHCLQTWLCNRVVTRRYEGVTTYSFKNHNCEVCHSEFPKFISVKGKMLELMPVRCDQRTVVLQKMEFDAKGREIQKNGKIVYCISRGENETKTVSIGRNDKSGIQLQDRSVSRDHAELVISPSGVQLSDCGSKFGTFVMLRGKESGLRAGSFMNNKWRFQLVVAE